MILERIHTESMFIRVKWCELGCLKQSWVGLRHTYVRCRLFYKWNMLTMSLNYLLLYIVAIEVTG